jgi:hypothetical protein
MRMVQWRLCQGHLSSQRSATASKAGTLTTKQTPGAHTLRPGFALSYFLLSKDIRGLSLMDSLPLDKLRSYSASSDYCNRILVWLNQQLFSRTAEEERRAGPHHA